MAGIIDHGGHHGGEHGSRFTVGNIVHEGHRSGHRGSRRPSCFTTAIVVHGATVVCRPCDFLCDLTTMCSSIIVTDNQACIAVKLDIDCVTHTIVSRTPAILASSIEHNSIL